MRRLPLPLRAHRCSCSGSDPNPNPNPTPNPTPNPSPKPNLLQACATTHPTGRASSCAGGIRPVPRRWTTCSSLPPPPPSGMSSKGRRCCSLSSNPRPTPTPSPNPHPHPRPHPHPHPHPHPRPHPNSTPNQALQPELAAEIRRSFAAALHGRQQPIFHGELLGAGGGRVESGATASQAWACEAAWA